MITIGFSLVPFLWAYCRHKKIPFRGSKQLLKLETKNLLNVVNVLIMKRTHEPVILKSQISKLLEDRFLYPKERNRNET